MFEFMTRKNVWSIFVQTLHKVRILLITLFRSLVFISCILKCTYPPECVKRECVDMFKGTPGIKVSVESLSLSLYTLFFLSERRFSLWYQSLPLKIVSIRVCRMSCLSSNFETLVQILQILLGRGMCVCQIQNYDARIFHPFFFLLQTCTQIEKERWKERPWIFEGDGVPLRK